ncbi:hypothetical protein KQX54_003178 [Cotesia glomerata]|uniref:Uncharacterized protein n=1 Tax=Cotesia glomerata TaxID=32391 RepID=A0AAV7IHV7_COTGL|nr:hypothetical protein KQX54_003178 [Cotesia glomerata]
MAVDWTGVAKTKPVPALGSAVGELHLCLWSLVCKAKPKGREERGEERNLESKAFSRAYPEANRLQESPRVFLPTRLLQPESAELVGIKASKNLTVLYFIKPTLTWLSVGDTDYDTHTRTRFR